MGYKNFGNYNIVFLDVEYLSETSTYIINNVTYRDIVNLIQSGAIIYADFKKIEYGTVYDFRRFECIAGNADESYSIDFVHVEPPYSASSSYKIETIRLKKDDSMDYFIKTL